MISIIIPVKNDEKFLQELFNEYKSQSFKDFEIITVIDSYTTDNSYNLCSNNADKSFIIEGTTTNRDMVTCALMRNYGAEQASGDILIHTDCDIGFQDNNQLDRIISYFISNNLDIASTKVYHQGGGLAHSLREISRCIIPTTTVMIISKKSVFNSIGQFYSGAWHDMKLYFAARHNGFAPVIIPEVLIHKRKLYM